MYCENCGHKLNSQDLFCEDCGMKVKGINDFNKGSNKTLWIVLGCVFGGLLLLIVLGIIFFSFIVFNYNTGIENVVDYDIMEDYYYDNNDEAIKIYKTDNDYLNMFPEIKDVYNYTKDIHSGYYSYYNSDYITTTQMNHNNLIRVAFEMMSLNKMPTVIDKQYDINLSDVNTFNVLDEITDDYYKVNNSLIVRSVDKTLMDDRVKLLFNVDINTDKISYTNDICDGYIKYIPNESAYKIYYTDCEEVDEYYTKIFSIQYDYEDILVYELVGYNKNGKVYDDYDGDYISSIDSIEHFYEELDEYEKRFKKLDNGEYYLYSIREI